MQCSYECLKRSVAVGAWNKEKSNGHTATEHLGARAPQMLLVQLADDRAVWYSTIRWYTPWERPQVPLCNHTHTHTHTHAHTHAHAHTHTHIQTHTHTHTHARTHARTRAHAHAHTHTNTHTLTHTHTHTHTNTHTHTHTHTHRANLKMSSQGSMPGAVKVDDKYSFMANAQPASQQGAADAAWDD